MNSLMESADIEEERKLMYVFITHSKDDLHLVNSLRRTLFGKEQINPISKFISVINSNLLESNIKDEHIRRKN